MTGAHSHDGSDGSAAQEEEVMNIRKTVTLFADLSE